MEALRTVMMLLGCGVALVLLPGSDAHHGHVAVAAQSADALPKGRTRGHIYIKLASDMDAATATAVESIVTKAINENEGGSDAAEQIKEGLTDMDGNGWTVIVVDLECKKFAASLSYSDGYLHAIMRSSGGWLRRIVLFK